METTLIALAALVVGVACGAVLAWLAGRLRGEARAAADTGALDRANATLLTTAEERLRTVSELTLRPVQEALNQVDRQIREIEKEREGAYRELTEQVSAMARTQDALRSETGQLVSALRAPAVRGMWGEMQLRRAVELAGMVERCDFSTQVVTTDGDSTLRPDLVVHLPGGKSVVVDAKCPLTAYLAAVDANDDAERSELLAQHGRQVRDHVKKLAAKAYAAQFPASPEFVVMFLPGEALFSAALSADPSLIEEGASSKVIIATPTTLIALLRAVAYGWSQEAIAENAQRIADAGRELHKRLSRFADHLAKVGRSLDSAVDAYNEAVGSLGSRVVPAARRFEELGAADGKLAEPAQVEVRARTLTGGGADGAPEA